MGITIVPFSADLEERVAAFNRRLAAGAVPYQFPANHVPDWLPPNGDSKLYHEYFLAQDEEEVRGGYIFKHQEFMIGSEPCMVGFFRKPLSEGAYDKRYTTLATQFLLHALKKNAIVFSLGIGGYEEPLAKLERGAGWAQWTLPFHFRVLRANRFLANIEHLRRKPARRWLIDFGRWSGLAPLAVHAMQAWRGLRSAATHSWKSERMADFGPWADKLWQNSRPAYSFIAVRDAKCLTALYPVDDSRFIRLRVLEGSDDVGWAVVMATSLTNHKHFGNMRLGSLVDCLAVPGKERIVVEAATKELGAENCDLIVSNQSHTDWCAALDQAGYLRGPSNFIFSGSKQLVQRIDANDPKRERLHLTRGDGDGPIHL